MKNSLRNRLTTYFILGSVVPLLIVGLILGWYSFQGQYEQALTTQQQTAQRVSIEVEAFLRGAEDELQVVATSQDLQRLSYTQQKQLLSNLLVYQEVFDELVLLDAEGGEQVRVSHLKVIMPEDLGSRAQADEFLKPKENGESYYSPVQLMQDTGEPLMIIAIPLHDVRTGEVGGVLSASVHLKRVWDILGALPMSEGESIYIVDAQNQVVAHRNPTIVLRGTTFDVPSQAGIYPGLEGTSTVLAFETLRLGEQTFQIVAEQAIFQALSLAITTIVIVVIVLFLALIVAGSFATLTTRQISRPIETLAVTAQSIAEGNLSSQAEVSGDDEIGALARAFNQMTAQLHELIDNLEQRVVERTADLQRRTAYLQASAEVGKATTSILETGELIQQAVELIHERFDLYYVGLFQIDEEREWAALRAGTGKAGKAMLARDHRLKLDEGSMIGWSIVNAQARIAQVVAEDAIQLATPELPDTRAEAALPLRSHGQVVGALTVQSEQVDAFDETMLATLQAMADQVAVALDNARLFEQTQQSYLEVERQVAEKTAELQSATAERERLQQEIIEAQKLAIQELSTPIIPVMSGVIVVPLVGSLDSERARDTMRRLLSGIQKHQAKVVLLDITGVSVMDSGVADHLDKAVQAAKLKGARTIITGMSDAVAETVVDLGISWTGIETLSDLQTGLQAALTGIKRRDRAGSLS